MAHFTPPTDWESVYAEVPGAYFFGEEPSQIARTALRYFTAFGGNPQTARALDLGSGEGRDTAFLAGAGCHVTARDVSPTGLEKTKALLTSHAISLERVDLAVDDICDYPYPPEAFDIAVAANVFQFLTPAEAPVHIGRLQATVKPGGICAVGVFSPAMQEWGADLKECYYATADNLRGFFPTQGGWLLLDRTEYWTYGVPDQTMKSFAFVVARKGLTP